jgi:chromosome segregation ATPase
MTVETDPHVAEELYTRYRKLATLHRETRIKNERLKGHREFISTERFSHLLTENEKVLAELAARLAPLTARIEAVLGSRKREARSIEAELAPVEEKIQEARILYKIDLISWRQLRTEIKRVKHQRNRLFKTLQAKRREIRQVQTLLDLRDPENGKRAPKNATPVWRPWRKAAPITSAGGQLQELRAEARALRGVLESLRSKKKQAAERAVPTRRETATVEKLLAAVQNGDTRALMTMFPASAGVTVCVREP